MKKIIIVFFLLYALAVNAQSDSAIRLNDIYTLVLKNHPVASQAVVSGDMGNALLLRARGNFDPVLSVEFRDKSFTNINYYNALVSEFKIPTRLGVDVKLNYELNNGARLNPENYTPSQGLLSAGLSLPIGQGLWTDERRNALKQAKVFVELSYSEQLIILNDLLLNVAEDYFDWYLKYYAYAYVEDGYELALLRFTFVKERFLNGDVAAIDTVEAAIEVQQRKINKIKAALELVNANLKLSTHLWDENYKPAFLNPNLIPFEIEIENIISSDNSIENIADSIIDNHPKLVYYRAKIKQLDIERKYKADLLKPNLRFEYNFLQQTTVVTDFANINPDGRANYKFGVSFKQPLLLRKERGDLKLVKLKIQDAEYEYFYQLRDVQNKIMALKNEINNMKEIVVAQNNLVQNFSLLRNGEQERFENGESSLLIINIRERNYIDSQIKFAELLTKLALTKEKYLYATGVLHAKN
jgi:outer membrane protein TolC